MNKMQVYASIKRWRAPKDMPQAAPRTHSLGYQLRQREAKESALRDNFQTGSSGQEFFSNTSSAGAQPAQHPEGSRTLSPPMQQIFQSHRLPSSQRQGSGIGVIDYPGAMPNTDWGTFDVEVPALTPGYQQPAASLNMYPSDELSPPPRTASQSSEPATSWTSAVPTVTTGTSPMDALDDIDWASIRLGQHDQLFELTLH